jgi:hypothetical protein
MAMQGMHLRADQGLKACSSMPEPCTADPTCECLDVEIPDGQCTGESGELTVETPGG